MLMRNTKVDSLYLFLEDDEFPCPLSYNTKIININYEKKYFDENGPNYRNRWSYMALTRCAFHNLLPNEKMVVYFDIDTIVQDDISELFDLPMEEYYIAGAHDSPGTRAVPKDYINSGVMLMNLEKMRNDGAGDKLIYDINHNRHGYPDQDAINEVFKGKILMLPQKYNYMVPLRKWKKNPTNAKIVHFAGDGGFKRTPVLDFVK